MVKSMTGYSRRRREEAGFSLSVGLKATNHRFLDVQVRVPAELEPLERVLRGIIKDRVTRGHVEVTVSLERTGPGELQIDQGLLEAYATACRKLAREYGFSAPDPVALLRIPGILAAGNGEIPRAEMERFESRKAWSSGVARLRSRWSSRARRASR